LAAVSCNKDCEKNPLKCFFSNVLGTLNLLAHIDGKKIWFLYVSTFQVKEPNFYGLTKLMGEELCRLYSDKIKIKILRLPVVYGENDRAYKLVSRIIDKLKKGEEVIVVSDKKLAFAYVEDVARMIESEVEVIDGGKAGTKLRITELIEAIKKCL